jgi:hypothetical protein
MELLGIGIAKHLEDADEAGLEQILGEAVGDAAFARPGSPRSSAP